MLHIRNIIHILQPVVTVVDVIIIIAIRVEEIIVCMCTTDM